MASRPNHYKLLQQLRGFAMVTNRRPPPNGISALWSNARPPILQAPRPKHKLFVSAADSPAPRPVKITFVA